MTKKKIRVALRKNRSEPPRPKDWTRDFRADDDQTEDTSPPQDGPK